MIRGHLTSIHVTKISTHRVGCERKPAQHVNFFPRQHAYFTLVRLFMFPGRPDVFFTPRDVAVLYSLRGTTLTDK